MFQDWEFISPKSFAPCWSSLHHSIIFMKTEVGVVSDPMMSSAGILIFHHIAGDLLSSLRLKWQPTEEVLGLGFCSLSSHHLLLLQEEEFFCLIARWVPFPWRIRALYHALFLWHALASGFTGSAQREKLSWASYCKKWECRGRSCCCRKQIPPPSQGPLMTLTGS